MTLAQQLMYLDAINAQGGVDPRTGRATMRFNTVEEALAYAQSKGAR